MSPSLAQVWRHAIFSTKERHGWLVVERSEPPATGGSGGGFDRNAIKPGTLMNMIDYIPMNPVRRGLVEKPEQWKWSSAAWYSSAGEGPIRVDPIPAEWLDDSS